MEIGDAGTPHRMIPEGGGAKQRGPAVNGGQKNDCTDDIKIEVDQGRAFGVFGSADARQNGGNAGADILSHDDREGGCEVDDSGGGESL